MDPVNDSLRARPDRICGSITSPDCVVVTTLTTPSGTPDSRRMSTKASIDSGVWDEGLMTTVQPAAMAGPISQVPIAIGKFHAAPATSAHASSTRRSKGPRR